MKLLAFIYLLLLKLRYKINISGLENVKQNKNYIVFPNHEALVDPQIVVSIIGQKINLSPVITETFYNIPILKYFFKIMGAVSIGDLNKNSYTKEEIEKSFFEINKALNSGKNILIYPSGQLYSQNYEVIKGKRSAFNLVQNSQESVEIIVVRTSGLWGSMWSKAYIGKTPNFLFTILKSIFIILVNFIFFVPKREVNLEIENYTKKLKDIKDLNIFNQTLEDFYNQKGKEELIYKKHFFFFNNTKNKIQPEISGSMESIGEVDEKLIPEEVKNKIINKIFEMKSSPLTPPLKREGDYIQKNLILDLYFDSLDIAEIKNFIQINFTKSSNPPITDLKTIGDLCYMAIGKSKNNENLKPCIWSETKNIFNLVDNLR